MNLFKFNFIITEYIQTNYKMEAKRKPQQSEVPKGKFNIMIEEQSIANEVAAVGKVQENFVTQLGHVSKNDEIKVIQKGEKNRITNSVVKDYVWEKK